MIIFNKFRNPSLLCSILFCLFIFSCSDNEDENNGNDDINPENALLVSEISSGGIDDSNYSLTNRFYYDDHKLTSMITEVIYDDNSLGNYRTLEFTYTDNKISRVDSDYGSDNIFEEQYNFSYDSQGRLSGWDICYYLEGNNCQYRDRTTITYKSNTLTENYIHYEGSDHENAGTMEFRFDTNGNFISGLETYQDIDDNGNPISVVIDFNIAYDNYNGIYKDVVGLTPRIMNILSEESIETSFSVYNNVTSIRVEVDGTEQAEYTYNYDYNDEGYPRKIVVTEVGFGNKTININYY